MDIRTEWMRNILDTFGPQIEALFANADPGDVNIVITDEQLGKDNNPASTSYQTRTITVNRDWLEKADAADVRGMLIHELVHAYGVADGKDADTVEKLAEYARYILNPKETEGWTPPKEVVALAEKRGEEPGQFNLAQSESGEIGAGDVPPHGGVWRPNPVTDDGSDDSGGGGDAGDMDTNNDGIISLEEYFAATGTGGGDGGLTETERRQRERAREARKRARRQQKRNTAASFEQQLINLGIGITDNIQALIDQGAARNYSINTFMKYLRETPEYAETFPGIFQKDGSLRMTETQYINTMKGYDDLAARAGVDLKEHDKVWAIKHDVTTTEMSQRVGAVSTLDRNRAQFAAFSREVVQAGGKPPTREELLRFTLKQDNAEWKDLWQDSVTRYTANQAGLTFSNKEKGQYTNLKQGVIERVSGKELTPAQMDAAFTELEASLAEDLPATKIANMGVSKRDIIRAKLGGKGSGEAQRKIDRALRNYLAGLEGTGHEQAQATQDGLGQVGGISSSYGG